MKYKKYNIYSFEQLEAKLLAMLDDLSYRMGNEGAPKNEMMAALGGVLDIDALANEIKEAANAYRNRIVVNRFRLAPYDIASHLLIDEDKPSQAGQDFVRQISALAKQGKVITATEFAKYKSIFDNHKKWKGINFYPAPDSLRKNVVNDDESLSDGRRPNGWPSVDEEEFVIETMKYLKKYRFVLAADAHRYESIIEAHPEFAKGHLKRVRGSEARRFLERWDGTELSRKISKKIKKMNSCT